jgi:hypothetical protein
MSWTVQGHADHIIVQHGETLHEHAAILSLGGRMKFFSVRQCDGPSVPAQEVY